MFLLSYSMRWSGSIDHIHWSSCSRYATLAEMANVNITGEDAIAKAAGLKPLDSISVWTMLSTPAAGSGRRELQLSTQALIQCTGHTCYKLITGDQPMDGWTGKCSSFAWFK